MSDKKIIFNDAEGGRAEIRISDSEVLKCIADAMKIEKKGYGNA